MTKTLVRDYYIDNSKKVYAPLENELELSSSVIESIDAIVKTISQYEPKVINDVQMTFKGDDATFLFTFSWSNLAQIVVKREEIE